MIGELWGEQSYFFMDSTGPHALDKPSTCKPT